MADSRNAQWFPLVVATCVAGCGALAAPETPEPGPPAVVDGKADGVDVAASAPLPEGADLDSPLSALFAPDDPVTTLELELIERVRAARRADPAIHEEGRSPYTIRYAVYNLRNPRIVEALADAHDDGVDVQVLLDDDQLDPARTWNTADERLIERGFEFAPDHRVLDDEGRRTADLIGVVTSGLMHFKTRLFHAPGFEAALTGSMNPGDNAVLNEETLHLVRDPALIARYEAAYEAIREGAAIHNRWDDGAALNVLFTPAASGPRAGTRLLQWIEEEDELILLMVFSLRDVTAPGVSRSLVELLGDKARAGVPVFVITDRKQSDGVDAHGAPIYRDDPTEDRLRAAGVHVYEATNRRTEFTAMHHKVGIFGLTHVRVVTDAANWTFAGLGSATRRARNHESQLFIDSDALDGGLTGRRYLAQWLRVLSRYASQTDSEPSFEEVRDRLQALAAWPSQSLVFSAEAQTRWGEGVLVRGDLPELGQWGALHDGLPLHTDGDRYPRWEGAPIALPLGVSLSWKLVASYGDGRVRWEQGLDRADVAAPGPLSSDPHARLHAEFR